jgi:glycosyltransferase involved in cell wall biosynthesis
MTLSIVIPVYNAEKTIRRAILSAQRLGDVEIICIDDGSTDDSVKTIESMYTSQLSLVLVRHQQNRGVGAARNTGISYSTRTWITFLDADDEIHADADPYLLLNEVNKLNPDLVICLHRTDGADLSAFEYELPIGKLHRDSLVVLAAAYLANPRGNSIISHCWGKIYRTDFLNSNNLTFREDLSIYEDTEFVARCLKAAYWGYFSRDILYRYTLSRGLSQSFTVAPLAFRFALEQFAEFAGSVTDLARANGIFLAKTLSLSAKLSFKRRIGLCRRVAAEVDYLIIDASAIHDPLLRTIVKKQWYRYERACALLIALKR